MELDSRATVLYVDDEELACKYFAHLAGARYRVLTAAGVDQALAQLAESGARIDVLVTDYRMPAAWAASCCRKSSAVIRTSCACWPPPMPTSRCCWN